MHPPPLPPTNEEIHHDFGDGALVVEGQEGGLEGVPGGGAETDDATAAGDMEVVEGVKEEEDLRGGGGPPWGVRGLRN